MVVRIICRLLILFRFNIFTGKQIVSPIRLVHFAGYDYVIPENCRIAIEAREIYYDKCTKGSWQIVDTGKPSRHPVLFAASVGSYGAYLADGSEYSGNCGDAVTLETLKDFHRERVQILANSVAHLIAFETTLNKLEAKAYAELLEEEAFDIPAWFTFASIDGISVGLISSIRKVTSKPIMILPNSGETYDGQSKQWVPSSGRVNEEIAEIVIEKWHEAGASLFGGCCRTTPNTMRAISKALSNKSSAVRDA